jgi:hypothetical protein
MRNDSLFVVIIVVMSPVPVPTILVPATPFPVFAVVSIRCRRRCIDYRGCRIDYGWRLVDYGREAIYTGAGAPRYTPTSTCASAAPDAALSH